MKYYSRDHSHIKYLLQIYFTLIL